jgi:hypothetical protein
MKSKIRLGMNVKNVKKLNPDSRLGFRFGTGPVTPRTGPPKL